MSGIRVLEELRVRRFANIQEEICKKFEYDLRNYKVVV